ncbi:Two pore potassium channel sup-9 [Brachionus plicatilis]|uniref:Two pore potassium channel sup-9 n=1 Tax=Brachionus plicatilis TaxID=10195 RepID=A0A3M7SXS5_BRAPC|nr:Two pore potassium channel sup-9 [Brachionus plicatilis]
MDEDFSNFSIKRQNIRTVSLVVCTLVYLLTGAAVFDCLESPNEAINSHILNSHINKFQQLINITDVEFENIYKLIIRKNHFKRNPQWEFGGSFYFCTLALALIGYGHSTPNTNIGKLFCIIYILFGIPISLIMFQSVGERLNGFLKYTLRKIKLASFRFYKFKNKNVSNKDLIVTEFMLTLVLVVTASYIFSVYEGWSYFDAIYYSFITLTTIGFGDFVPLQKNNYLKYNPIYVAFTIFFIITGLTILASSTNLLVLYLVNINSEEKLRKRIWLKMKKQEQIQKMLIGDVISTVNTQDVVTYLDEKPNLAAFTEDKSVCSCDDIFMCYKLCTNKRKFDAKNYFKKKLNGVNIKEQRYYFSIKRKPLAKIEHISRYFDFKTDNIVQEYNEIKYLRKFANEQNFKLNKISRRESF